MLNVEIYSTELYLPVSIEAQRSVMRRRCSRVKIQISQCASLVLRGRKSGLYPDMIFPPNFPLEAQLLPFLESGALDAKSRVASSIPQHRRGETFFHFQPYCLGSSGGELPILYYGLEPPFQHHGSVPQYVHTSPTEMLGKSFLAPGKVL